MKENVTLAAMDTLCIKHMKNKFVYNVKHFLLVVIYVRCNIIMLILPVTLPKENLYVLILAELVNMENQIIVKIVQIVVQIVPYNTREEKIK